MAKEKQVYVYRPYDILNPDAKFYIEDIKSCLTCKYCIDVIWDYTNGPYMTICGISKNDINTCNSYEDDGEEHEIVTLVQCENGKWKEKKEEK